eukprot:1375584-Rhodomonas_salina.2
MSALSALSVFSDITFQRVWDRLGFDVKGKKFEYRLDIKWNNPVNFVIDGTGDVPSFHYKGQTLWLADDPEGNPARTLRLSCFMPEQQVGEWAVRHGAKKADDRGVREDLSLIFSEDGKSIIEGSQFQREYEGSLPMTGRLVEA